MTTYTTTLDGTGPQFDRPNGGGCSGPANHYYDALDFHVSADGNYTFTVSSVVEGNSGDTYVFIYTSFDPASPCDNLVVGNDDASGLLSEIITPLVAGTSYVLVTTVFSGTATIDEINWDFSSPDGNVLSGMVPVVPISVNISDPCACGNLLNILDATGEVTLFHEEVTITATAGQTWELTSLNSGDALDAAGVALALPAAMTETPAGSGTYVIEFFHTPGTGYDANFSNGTPADDQTMTNSCSGPCLVPAADIPTMSQWGLMILGLLFLTFSSLFAMQKEGSLQFVNANASSSTQFINISELPFNKALYAKLLVGILLGFVALFSLATQAFGYEMTTADLPGSIIFSAIFAYFASLFFVEKK
ncbi:MAG: hypothetical protein ACPG5B_01165 [Chitinophagales bacterium]